jgi:hypothetical protein
VRLKPLVLREIGSSLRHRGRRPPPGARRSRSVYQPPPPARDRQRLFSATSLDLDGDAASPVTDCRPHPSPLAGRTRVNRSASAVARTPRNPITIACQKLPMAAMCRPAAVVAPAASPPAPAPAGPPAPAIRHEPGPLEDGADGGRLAAPIGHRRPVPVEHDGLEPTTQPGRTRTPGGLVAVRHSAARATAAPAVPQSES